MRQLQLYAVILRVPGGFRLRAQLLQRTAEFIGIRWPVQRHGSAALVRRHDRDVIHSLLRQRGSNELPALRQRFLRAQGHTFMHIIHIRAERDLHPGQRDLRRRGGALRIRAAQVTHRRQRLAAQPVLRHGDVYVAILRRIPVVGELKLLRTAGHDQGVAQQLFLGIQRHNHQLVLLRIQHGEDFQRLEVLRAARQLHVNLFKVQLHSASVRQNHRVGKASAGDLTVAVVAHLADIEFAALNHAQILHLNGARRRWILFIPGRITNEAAVLNRTLVGHAELERAVLDGRVLAVNDVRFETAAFNHRAALIDDLLMICTAADHAMVDHRQIHRSAADLAASFHKDILVASE